MNYYVLASVIFNRFTVIARSKKEEEFGVFFLFEQLGIGSIL
jgi:hypothetical protein